MTRFTLALALLVAPFTGVAQESEEKTLPELTIEALAEMAGGEDRIGELELSSAVSRNGAKMMCATTPAYSASGSYIGLTYWQVNFNDDGDEVKAITDVTGLNHECYGSDLKRYGN